MVARGRSTGGASDATPGGRARPDRRADGPPAGRRPSPSDSGARRGDPALRSRRTGALGADDEPVRPRGGVVRRMRTERGWSPRALIDAIADASERSTGIARSITPNLLAGIEDHDERVPYETLCLVAAGFDCDPIELLGDAPEAEPEPEGRTTR